MLRGARQVGKTTSVDLFGAEFRQYVALNLDHPGDREIFDQGLPLGRTLEAIFFLKNADPAEASTLLFLDEIQSSPHAVQLLRYFAEERADLAVVAAGSLLEVALDRYRASFPVGRVEFLYQYPLTFAEYAAAVPGGWRDAMAAVPCPDYAVAPLRRLFRDYVMVGGMPEIAASYLEHRDLGRLTRLYEGLLVSYADDAAKYARGPAQLGHLRHVIETAPLQAGERISFQGFGGSNFRSREMADALRTLEQAMLLFLLYPTTAGEPPALPDRRKSPRLLYLDTGLMNYRAGLQTGFLSGGLGALYRGRLPEHVVGQELMAADLRTSDKPRYWVRQKAGATAEVDYLHRYRDHLVPVEVKSGKSGALRSLHQSGAVFRAAIDDNMAKTLTPRAGRTRENQRRELYLWGCRGVPPVIGPLPPPRARSSRRRRRRRPSAPMDATGLARSCMSSRTGAAPGGRPRSLW